LRINIDKSARLPVYIQIRNQIRAMIHNGSLPAGSLLPPERKLAESLGVNRSTILAAYRELKADGLVDSHVGKGTVVLSVMEEVSETHGEFEQPLYMHYFSQISERSGDPFLRDLLVMANRDDIISFSAGISAIETDPVEALAGMEKELIEQPGHAALKHTPTEGIWSFREQISLLMQKRGIPSAPDEILVLSGSQQGIDIAARVFIDPGDVVIVEEPSFFSALQIFNTAGARIVGVPVDDQGMRVDILEQLLQRHRPKLIYTMPTFQNPSGISMSMDRRRRLLEVAYRKKVLILEDDPYGNIVYEGAKKPTLKEMDKYGYVLYLSTFSKILFPGIRIGWMAAPAPIVHRFTMIKQLQDLHANSISQWIVERFLASGKYEEHVRKLCAEYKAKRDLMLDALLNKPVEGMEWIKPAGGFYIWCRLPEGVPHMALLMNASEKGVSYVPGTAFYTGGRGGQYMRLNFTYPSREDIVKGIERLKAAIAATRKAPKTEQDCAERTIKPIV
jgi:2-aminoadipate transaminase